jgi:hypothetical protein
VAICANGAEPEVEGDLVAGPALIHEITLNLRATGIPAQIEAIIQKQLRSLDGAILHQQLNCFSPSAPVPERRIAKVPADLRIVENT